MLKFKSKVIPTLSIFFRHKNDVDIFIEDSNDEEFYSELFKSILDGKRANKIISCGCKTSLIEACENDQNPRNRHRVYLADGDLDLIFSEPRSDLRYLFFLKRYCIENFLFEEESIIEIIHDNTVLDRTKIQDKLGMTKWFETISKPLIDLFIHYAISHKYGLGLRTTSISVFTLCKKVSKIDVLDIDAVDNKIREFKIEIINSIGEENYLKEIYDLNLKWPVSVDNLLTIVSAKDYLLPLLRARCKKIKGKETFSLGHESIRLGLAKKNKFESLNELKTELLK
jgi:hypothetical protein